VLVSDRINCSPDIMENIKQDIIQVLSKYVEIDMDGLEVSLSEAKNDGDRSLSALCANIPIKDMKKNR